MLAPPEPEPVQLSASAASKAGSIEIALLNGTRVSVDASVDEGADVISLAPGTKVYLACRPDLRNGFDGLAAQAQQVIGATPFSAHLFIFRGKRCDYFKGLYWAGVVCG